MTFDGEYDMPAVMIKNAVSRIQSGTGINIIPFKTIKDFFRHYETDAFCVNIISNIVIFIPWGFFLPLLKKKNQKIIYLLFLLIAITVFIEFFQLFIKRNTDIDDIILNFAGGCIGAIIYFITAKAVPKIKMLAK